MVSDPQNRFASLSTSATPPQRTKLNFDKRILLTAFLISLPGLLVAELFLWLGDHSLELKWTLTLLLTIAWLIGSSILHSQVIRPLHTVSTMVAAIPHEHFPFRLPTGARHPT